MKTAKEDEIEKALLQGKRYDVIARELHVSAKTIAKVSKMMRELPPSQVFMEFEADTSPRQVVIDTNADPKTILDLYRVWTDMQREELFLLILKKIRELLEKPALDIKEPDVSKMEKMLETVMKAEKIKETRTPEYWLKRLEGEGRS